MQYVKLNKILLNLVTCIQWVTIIESRYPLQNPKVNQMFSFRLNWTNLPPFFR